MKLPTVKYLVINSFAILFTFAMIVTGCERREVKWAAVKGDIRDVPAKAASVEDVSANKIIVSVVPMKDSKASALEALSTGKVDVAYIDARAALAAMATGKADIEVIAITYRDARGELERLLVVDGKRAKEDNNFASLVLKKHRAGVKFLQDKNSTAISLLSEWAGLNEADSRKALSRARWESSRDVADLIDLLDDLRRAGDISGTQADNLATRLMKQK